MTHKNLVAQTYLLRMLSGSQDNHKVSTLIRVPEVPSFKKVKTKAPISLVTLSPELTGSPTAHPLNYHAPPGFPLNSP